MQGAKSHHNDTLFRRIFRFGIDEHSIKIEEKEKKLVLTQNFLKFLTNSTNKLYDEFMNVRKTLFL